MSRTAPGKGSPPALRGAGSTARAGRASAWASTLAELFTDSVESGEAGRATSRSAAGDIEHPFGQGAAALADTPMLESLDQKNNRLYAF